MLVFMYRFLPIKSICLCAFLILLSLGLVSCGDRIEVSPLSSPEPPSVSISAGKLSEVAPPAVIRQLNQTLEQYQPQVAILSPPRDSIFQETTVAVKLQVRDLPIFKDPDLEMGPHLKLILDNEPAREIYDIDKPVTLENLAPGTHTLRVFASRPWHESFKNEGAYAQTTFHILTKTDTNAPDPSLPLLTYSRPQGSYGAEPILVDFYLTNAPLRLVAKENSEIADWRIRVTINGQSFVLDNWQPVYLTGFEKGNNWVQLEFLDRAGNRVDNVFNTTVRLIEYNPKGQDPLSKLMRGELATEYARSIVDPTYKAKLTPTPSPTPTPTPQEAPTARPEVPVEQPTPTPQETPTPIEKPTAPEIEVTSQPPVETSEPLLSEPKKTPTKESVEPTETIAPQPETSTAPTPAAPSEESLPTNTEAAPATKTPSANQASRLEKPQWLDRVLSRFQTTKTDPNSSPLSERSPTASSESNMQSELAQPQSESI
ncbi:hypothetical protein NIES593_13830 [Hydrococcus rivularis NIES-593]|uniref:FHA domain containing protein n=1 Tax=Hydrococcus rivularis NIES-593 TaxID=1921803 RepID=A0A1U7HEP2_9CYAN|nr:hypothetical protein NIES593_13830 [Hydrococcus rivularis NIES-593]